MDASTTVAVDILIRTTLGTATSDFNRFFANLEREAKNWVNRINRILGGVKFNAPAGFGSPVGGGSRGGDAEMRRAQSDIARMQRERERMETNYTRFLERQAEQRYRGYTKGLQSQARATKQFLDDQQRSTGGHSFFSGTFWGTLGGNIASRFIAALSGIPSAVKAKLDEAVKIASERQNALLGLGSVAAAKGVDERAAKEAVKNLRLVRAGVVDLGNATTGLKNLLASGFSLPEAIKLLEAFSDTAAFGKQAALDYGEAIRGATEGIKNGNSILVDNVGLTKNLSIILKEAGYDEKDLMRVQTDLNVRLALFNGLLREAAINQGDADKLTKTYTGSTAALDMAYQNLYAAVGQVIIQNPDLVNANAIVIKQLEGYTKEVGTADSETARFIENATTLYAKFKVGVIGTVGAIVYTFGYAISAIGTAAAALATVVVAPFEAVAVAIGTVMNKVANTVVDTVNAAIDLATNNPFIATMLGGTLGAGLVGAQKLQRFEQPELFQFTKQAAADTAYLAGVTRDLFNTANRLQNEANSAIRDLQGLRDRSRTVWGQEDEWANRHNLPFAKSPMTNLSGAPDSETGKKAKAISARDFRPSPDAQALISAAAQLGISPLDLATIIAYETRGTFSPTIKGGAGGRYTGLIQFGQEEWKKYVEPLGASGRTFAGQMPAVVKFFQDRFGGVGRQTAGASLTDLYRTVSGGNPNVPLSARDQNGTILSHIMNMTGRAKRQALDRYFGGSAGNVREATGGLDFADVLEEERMARFRQVGGRIREMFKSQPVTTTDSQITTQVTTRTDQFIGNLRESLNLREREAALVIRIGATEREIAAYQEAYVLSLIESNVQAKVDLGLAERRLPLAEAEAAFAKSRADLTNESRDYERDIALLQMQNADAAFVYQRQANALARERLQYEQDITELRDALTNAGKLDALRLEREYLNDILELREREVEALATINRSNLEIANQTVYSANQANAKVLEFMANQKGVTEIMADFKIGLIESGYDLIDRGLDAILPKMGRLTSVVKDLLSSFLRLAVNAAFRRLFGLDGGGGAGTGVTGGNRGGAGGLGGFLQNILFGRGAPSGGTGRPSGAVTTPPFNPNTFNFNDPFGIRSGGFRTPTTFAGASASGGTLGQDLLSDIAGSASAGGFGGASAGVGTATTAAAGSRGISKALSSQIAFGLSGAMLGSQLGQGSGIGQVLGGVGGGIIGILGSTIGASGGLASGGIFGSTAGILGLSGAATFGIGLAIGGALLLGSYLFGRAARRRREKREVERLSGDVVGRVQQLLADVKSFKIDGASALAQAQDIRQQFVEETAKLKTKPAKTLARQKLAIIDGLISQLKTEAGRADRVRQLASITDERLIPTFHTGGFGSYTGSGYGERMAMVKNHEAVITSSQIHALGGYRKLQSVGVRGVMGTEPLYEKSFGARSPVGAVSTTGKMPPVYVVGVFDESVADDIIGKVSNLGMAQKVRFLASKNIAGMVDAIEDTMAGK